MAASSYDGPEATDGPVLRMVKKLLLKLQEEYSRIEEMEKLAANKKLNSETDEVLRSKTVIAGEIIELKLFHTNLLFTIAKELSLSSPLLLTRIRR